MKTKMVMRSVALVGMVTASGLFAAKSTIFSSPSQAQTAQEPAPVLVANATPQAAPARPALPPATETAAVELPAQAPVPGAAQALAPVPAPVPVPVAAPVPAPVPVPVPVSQDLAPLTPEMHATEPAAGTETEPQQVSPLGLPCGLSVTASAMATAVVALDIMDPCQPNVRIEIEHGTITVTASTDAMGLLTLDVPAFEAPAFFTVRSGDGQAVATVIAVPDLDEYDRVALSWRDDRELELHAMELGAEFGGPGHIWEGARGHMADALTGQGGYLVEVGDPALPDARVSQIYTFPRAGLSMGDRVRIGVDAPITAGNCGQPVQAQTVQMVRGGAPEVTPITLTMPGCDAVGEYLVLQNLFQDLRLASN